MDEPQDIPVDTPNMRLRDVFTPDPKQHRPLRYVPRMKSPLQRPRTAPSGEFELPENIIPTK